MPKSLSRHADELYDVFEQLMRAYLFRDRSHVSPRTGLTVSQVYALDRLGESDGMGMAELAAALYLDPSSVTRLVDQLEAKNLAKRHPDPADRRALKVVISKRGAQANERVRASTTEDLKASLKGLTPASREAAIDVFRSILESFKARHKEDD